jgi:transmembrane sensor
MEHINISDNIDPSKYTAWKEGKIIFRGDSMNEVARRIERWYNIEVELVDKELESFVIRGIFQDDSLEEVLHFLSMTSPIKYQIIDRPIDNSESVQKKKVLIYIKDKN